MSPRRSALGAAVAASLALLLQGCAATVPGGSAPSPLPGGRPAETTRPPAPSPTPTPTTPPNGTQVGTTASGGRIVSTAPAPAMLDTLPSADATQVLDTIPEPVEASDRVAAPRDAASRSAPSDTSSREASEAGVPVPQETRPLGERASPAASDTSAPAVAPPPAASTPPVAGAASDTCWKVQVAAVPEAERAEGFRTAAESQLLVPWVVEKDGALLKVRTRRCMSGADADELRKRAVAAGFAGAFRFRSPSP